MVNYLCYQTDNLSRKFHKSQADYNPNLIIIWCLDPRIGQAVQWNSL